METVDRINRMEGKGSVFLAAQDVRKPWYMRQKYHPLSTPLNGVIYLLFS